MWADDQLFSGPTGSQPAKKSRRSGEDSRKKDEEVHEISQLSEEQRMLLNLRDELYEGRWDLFVSDLQARLAGHPHVFEIGTTSDRLKETITSHLQMIEILQAMEQRLGVDLGRWLKSNEAP